MSKRRRFPKRHASEHWREVLSTACELQPSEVDFLRQVHHHSRKLRLSQDQRDLLDKVMSFVYEFKRLPGFLPLSHPHRLGQYVNVSFFLPVAMRSMSVTVEALKDYRRGICTILEEALGKDAFGKDYVLGYRFGPHHGHERGRHVHVLLSLLRFSTGLRQRAKSFVTLDEESKRRILPTFFVGPHLDPDCEAMRAMQEVLVGPYAALVRNLFGEFTDDQGDLVNVGERPVVQTAGDRVKSNKYLSRVYKRFDDIVIRGFYKTKAGPQIHLWHKGPEDAGHDRVPLDTFIREYLLLPMDRWLPRGSKGFLIGGNTFARIVDYAAKLPHPTNPKLCFLDQTPRQLERRAAKAREELADDPAITAMTTPSRPAPKEHPFPHDQFGRLLAEWPFVSLRFIPPPAYWTEGLLLERYKQAREFIEQILQRHLAEEHAMLGFLLLPDVAETSNSDALCVRALISKAWLDDADEKLASLWRGLPSDKQTQYLPAFFRRAEVKFGAKVMTSLRTAWENRFLLSDEAHISKAVVEHLDDASVHPEDLFRQAPSLIEDHARRQIATLEPIRDGDKWFFCLPESCRSHGYSSPKTLRRQLTSFPGAVKAYGFFHNRSDGFGWVARKAVGHDLATLRKRGAKTFEKLCEFVGVKPTKRDERSVTEWIGKWRRTG